MHVCLSKAHPRALSAHGNARSSIRLASAPPSSEASKTSARPQSFPRDYTEAIRQAQESVKTALADGHKLIEVEFPTLTLDSVPGDGEGQNEMNANMGYLKQFLQGFRPQAGITRVFFPDNNELKVAVEGQSMDPNAGRAEMDPTFDRTPFQLGYLTKQSALWAALGLNLGNKFSPVDLVKDTDEVFIIAYPSFNPREELSAVMEIHAKKASVMNKPIIIFNGELDRVRGGYYPGLFFPEVQKFADTMMPKFTQAYYIRNIKGSNPGALFRAYPGPWQVLRRDPLDSANMRTIYTSDKMPSLKEVATEILPEARK